MKPQTNPRFFERFLALAEELRPGDHFSQTSLMLTAHNSLVWKLSRHVSARRLEEAIREVIAEEKSFQHRISESKQPAQRAGAGPEMATGEQARPVSSEGARCECSHLEMWHPASAHCTIFGCCCAVFRPAVAEKAAS